jgi:hypothetical protein
MQQYIVGGLGAVLVAGGLIASTPQASAGCENPRNPLNPNAELCDGPIQPDGTWERCVNYSQPGVPYSQSECHLMGPNQQTLPIPFYQPPTHIDP